MLLGLLETHMVILPYSSTGLNIYPLLFFVLCCYLLPFVVLIFYLYVLCSSLLIYFVSHYVRALYSTTESWCIPSLHVVFLKCNRPGLQFPPS